MLRWLAPLALAVACGGHPAPSATSRAALVDDNSPLPVPSDTIVSPDLSASNKVVGSLSGTSSVSPDGQAHYAIPLWVAPGRAGMQPELALEYASRSSNGILGVGWSLSGFSQITRCPRGYATDGVAAPITFDDHDVFCLDGQHLKQLGNSTSYPRYYHTERDIFTRVVANAGTSGPSTFIAYEKNGRIDEYTGYSLGRFVGSQPINSIWLLTKTSDRYGNTITYAYDQFKSNNFADWGDYYYPSTITYTGSSTTAGNRSVHFFYTDRNDPQTSYSVGLVCIKHLLDHIEMWGPGDQKLRTYTFSYAGGPVTNRRNTWRSRLSSVTASDAGSHALAATSFEWEDGQPGFTQLDTSVKDYASGESLKGFQIIDVNQDGFGDLLYVTKDSNGTPEYGVRLWKPGVTDFGPLYELHVKPAKDKWGIYTFPRAALALGNSIGLLMTGNPTGTNWPDPTPFFLMVQTLADGSITGNTVYPFDSNADMVVPGDFDGDGLADIILGYTKNGNGVFTFLRNTQQASLSFAAPVTLSSPAYPVLPTKGTGMPMRTVDFDGDGRQELVVCFKTPYPQYLPYDITTTGYTSYPEQFNVPQEIRGLIPCDSKDNAIYADLNGDGLDDTLYTRQGSGAWSEIFFNNSPTSIRDSLQGIHGDANITYDEQFDNGTTALIDYEGVGTWQLLSTAPKQPDSIVPATWPYTTADSSLDFYATSDNALAVGDLTGDGLDDVVQWENGRFEVYKRNGKRPDMLTRVVDGVGAETRFIYAPVSDPTVYTNDLASYAYPLRRVNGGMWVVAQQQVSNGVKADPTQYFHKYTNGVIDIQGRGFLGFNRHEVDYYENGSQRSRIEGYDNTTRWLFTEPYAGLPRAIDTRAYDAKGHVVHEELTSTKYSVHWRDDTTIYFPYPLQSESQTFDLDASGALVKTADRISYIDAIDDYGNVLTSRSDNGARDLRQRDITYRYASSAWSNDTTWLINAPVKVVTQSRLALPPPAHGPVITTTTAYDYDAKGALTWKIDEPDYDANGNVVALAQPQPDGMQTRFTHYTHDPDGQVGSITVDVSNTQTSQARTHTFYRDDADRVAVTRIRNPLGRISHIAMHPGFGVIAATQDQNGLYSRYQYDTFGRLKRSERNGSEPYSVNYYGYTGGTGVDSSKPPLEVVTTGDAGETTATYFDILGRPTKRSALARNDGSVVYDEVQYDERGRVAATSRPHFDQATTWFDQFSYDDVGRPLRQQFADGRVSQWTYRALANTGLTIDHFDAETTDPHVLRTTKTFDYAGRLISSVEHAAAHNGRQARNLSVKYSYGNFDTLVDVDSNGVGSTSFAYDRSQRQVYAQDAGLGQRWFSYDPFDEMVTEVVGDANGNQGEVRQQVYDGLGRPKTRTTRDGTTTWTWDSSANGIGKLGSTTSPTGVSHVFGYDANGRLNEESYTVDGTTVKVTTTLDPFGRVSLLQYPTVNGGRFAVSYGYGKYNALTTIKDAATNQALWTAIDSDDGGTPTNPSGRFPQYQLGDKIKVRFGEDPSRVGYPASIIATANGHPIQSLLYGFDTKGFLATRNDTVNGFEESFQYDELNRLEYWTTPRTILRYDYDDAGNFLGRTYESGGGTNQTFSYTQERGAGPYGVTTAGTALLSYDPEGNRTQAGGRTYTATAAGLPLTIADPAGSFSFAYDEANARLEKKVSGAAGVDSTITLPGLYRRHATPGAAVEHFYTVHGPDGVVAEIEAVDGAKGTTTFYILPDHLGSADTITDASGNVREIRKFEPYGTRIDPGNPPGPAPSRTTPVAYGFTGHEHDWELGLINMKGRIYDPLTTRFLSPDPTFPVIDRTTGLNSYAYVENRPTTMTDPTGFAGYEQGGEAPAPPPPMGGDDGKGRGVPTVSTTQAASDAGYRVHVNALDPNETQAAYSARDRQRDVLLNEFVVGSVLSLIPQDWADQYKVRPEFEIHGRVGMEAWESLDRETAGRAARAFDHFNFYVMSFANLYGEMTAIVGEVGSILGTLARAGNLFGPTATVVDTSTRYLAPGVGTPRAAEYYSSAWIKRSVFRTLKVEAGEPAFKQFIAALGKGIVGPKGQSGIKILASPVRGFTHELKIMGSASRLLGRIDDNGILVFEEFLRGGLH